MDGIFTSTSVNEVVSSVEPETVISSVSVMLAPFNRNSVPLTRDTQIAQDLEVDSVAIFDIIMDVEDRYDVTFPMEAISEIKTIGELSDMIETLRSAS